MNCKKLILCLLALVLLVAAPAAWATGEEEDTLDFSKLEQLLEVASYAREENYTAESWQVLEEALAEAEAVMTMENCNQIAVDNAVSKLAKALSQLSSDYSLLNDAISQAEQYLLQGASEELIALYRAVLEAQTVFGSGNQAAVDQAAEKISQCLQALQDMPQEDTSAGQADAEQVVRYERQTPVLWIVLLSISVVINLGFVALLLLGKKPARRRQVDDVPLVDYDIDDDVI